MPDPAPIVCHRDDLRTKADDDVIIGAGAIAREVFENQLSPRQIYRLASDEDPPWPILRVRGKLMCRRSVMRAHMARLEAQALGICPASGYRRTNATSSSGSGGRS